MYIAALQRRNQLPATVRAGCATLYQSCLEAVEVIKATKPEVIFLNTPHGLCLSKSLCVYLNDRGKGAAEWKDQWMEYDVNIELDSKLAKSFLDHLQSEGVAAEGMLAYTACEAPLRWGEVIPLWYLRDLTAKGVKVVILSNPLLRNKELSLNDVTKVGRSVSRYLNSLEQRVLYVVSGDLAHSHDTDCTLPLYLPDPRWNIPKSEKAIPFDVCVENWVKAIPYVRDNQERPVKTTVKYSSTWDAAACSNAEMWITEAFCMRNEAFECGIYGCALLHGILSANVLDEGASFDAQLFCRLAPTYYGMLVVSFIKK